MICDDVIYLITDDPTPGGVFEARQSTERRVLCTVRSVSSVDYYRAHAAGLSPEKVFVLADLIDYNGETLLRHGEGQEARYYRVLRTYANGRQLEITVEIAKAYDLQPDGNVPVVGIAKTNQADLGGTIYASESQSSA